MNFCPFCGKEIEPTQQACDECEEDVHGEYQQEIDDYDGDDNDW